MPPPRGSCGRSERTRLPAAKLTWVESVIQGKWDAVGGEPVRVPAGWLLQNGVWYRADGDVMALLVRDPRHGPPWAYLVVEPAGRDHAVMVKSDWQFVLAGGDNLEQT